MHKREKIDIERELAMPCKLPQIYTLVLNLSSFDNLVPTASNAEEQKETELSLNKLWNSTY